MAKKEEFINWMENIDRLKTSTINLYSSQIDTISEELKGTGEIINNIYSIDSSNEIDKIIKIFYSNSDREKQDIVGHRLKSSSLRKYKQYLQYFEKNENHKYDLYVTENDVVNEINNIEYNLTEIEETEKLSIIKYRIGQSGFRKGLIEKHKKCQLCDIDIDEILIASHIKPWSKSDNKEKLDLNNGLLLCCIHDKLFDIGLISFNILGDIIISDKIIISLYDDLNLCKCKKIDINSKMNEYLKWHLENKFIK